MHILYPPTETAPLMFSHPLHSFPVYPPHRSSSFPHHCQTEPVHRKRRDVEAEGSSNKLAFSLTLSNMTHYFEVSPSTDIVSPRYVLLSTVEHVGWICLLT